MDNGWPLTRAGRLGTVVLVDELPWRYINRSKGNQLWLPTRSLTGLCLQGGQKRWKVQA